MIIAGLMVSFTGHNVRHADGRQLQRIGIKPTIDIIRNKKLSTKKHARFHEKKKKVAIFQQKEDKLLRKISNTSKKSSCHLRETHVVSY